MKLKIVASLALFFVSCFTYGQNDYMNFSYYYSFPFMKTNDYALTVKTFVRNYSDEEERTYRNNNYSFGEGYALQLDYGTYFNEKLGLELGITYFKSNNLIEIYENEYYSDYSNEFIGTVEEEHSFTGKEISFVTNMVNRFKLNEKVSFSIKNGFVWALCSFKQTSEETYKFENSGFDRIEASADYILNHVPRFSVGYNFATGLEYKFSDKWSAFADFKLKYLSYNPKKAKYKEYNVSQTDDIFQTDPSDIDFVDEIVRRGDENDQLSKQLRRSHSFSSYGIVGGIKISF